MPGSSGSGVTGGTLCVVSPGGGVIGGNPGGVASAVATFFSVTPWASPLTVTR